jgi:hypothetical protein
MRITTFLLFFPFFSYRDSPFDAAKRFFPRLEFIEKQYTIACKKSYYPFRTFVERSKLKASRKKEKLGKTMRSNSSMTNQIILKLKLKLITNQIPMIKILFLKIFSVLLGPSECTHFKISECDLKNSLQHVDQGPVRDLHINWRLWILFLDLNLIF